MPAKNFDNSGDGWDTVVEPYPPTFQFETVGQYLIGTYVKARQIEQEDMNNPGEKRLANVYEIAMEDGTKYSVWGTFAIDSAFENITEGEMVRITWKGKVPIDGGRRTVNQFQIDVKRS